MTPAGLLASGSVRCRAALALGATIDATITASEAMNEARPTAPSLEKPGPPDPGTDHRTDGHGQSPLIAAPAVFVLVLLLLATVFHGAFYLRDWGPPAALVLGTLWALQVGGGGLPLGNRWVMAMLAGIWGFAGWTLLSMLWSETPAGAWE